MGVVTIIGRTNVGKSTLFNKIIGEKKSIVDDFPGVTRDGVFSVGEWNGKSFNIIDTAGFEPKIKNNNFLKEISVKTKEYLDESDVIVFVVDLKSGVVALDLEISNLLKKTGKTVLLCVNKCDSIGEFPEGFYEFYSLFQDNIFPVSAIHGHGLGDLLDCIIKKLPESTLVEKNLNSIKIAIVGKPNVGKSSILNALIGKNKLLVSDIAGTTRDSIDVHLKHKNKDFVFVDTAGIRKKSKIKQNVEHYSVLRSFLAVEKADVVIIVLDAALGALEQDLKIAGYVKKKGKSSIIAVNKSDLIEKDEIFIKNYIKNLDKEFNFMAYAPKIFISAKTGKRLKDLYDLVENVYSQANLRLTTGMLNELLSYAISKVQPPSKKGKRLKIFYMTQVSCKPPTFVIFVNKKELLNFSYKRYIENQIRKEYKFFGTPLKFIIKENKS